MAGQLIGAGRQGRVAGQGAVLGRVHVSLAVLDADTHGEGLLLHVQARAVEHFKGVPGAVAQGQYHLMGGQVVGLAVLTDGDGPERAAFHGDTLQPRAEADVRPGSQQLPPQGLQRDVEHIRAHMGLGIGENILRRTAAHQCLHDKAVAQILRAGVQLAVGKRARAALAELDVALRVQQAGAPEAGHVLLALLHRLPPLQQDGPCAAPGQHQRGEQTCRACAHHDRSGVRFGHGGGQGIHLRTVGGHPLVPAAAQHLVLPGHIHRQGIHEGQALTGVDGPAQHRAGADVLRGDAEEFGTAAGKRRFRFVRQQPYLVDAQQGRHLLFKMFIIFLKT